MSAHRAAPQLTLRHEPYGERHPYEPLPYERCPRDPWVGQAVTLGVETGVSPAEAVWCIWSTKSSPLEMRSEGVRTRQGETGELWEIRLPAFSRMDVVTYRLFARSAAEQVESGPFVMPVAAWIPIEGVASLQDRLDGVSAVLSTGQPGLSLAMTVTAEHQGGMALHLAAGQPGTAADADGPTGEILRFRWNDLTFKLAGSPLRMELGRESDGLTVSASAPLEALVTPEGWVRAFRLGFESPDEEAFYGFGERFNAFDQRGNRLDNIVYAQYLSQGKRSYIPVPFFLSSRGYGVWVNTKRQAHFDLAATDKHAWSLIGYTEDDASLKVQFFLQPHPKKIVQAFTDLTGKPKLPPAWAFGLWMSSNDWNTQHEVLRQLHLTQQHEIPSSVLVIEAWSDEINFYPWNDSHYAHKPSDQAYPFADYHFPAEGHWPDPKAMIEELHQAGLRLVLWQIPVMKAGNPAEHLDETQNNADQAYAIQKGYVVRKADGTPHRIEAHSSWFVGSLVFDFTNPEAARWWFAKRAYLVQEMGVDGFKTDGGEHVWDTNARFFNGMDGARGINHYPLAYEGAYASLMDACRGEDSLLFSRSGYTGAQSVSCHWTGDEASTWEAFRATIRAMLNAGICGFSFLGWDIAGFAGPVPEAELYLRAAAFSAFCPIMQYHSDGNARRIPSRDRTPWNVQEQTGDAEVIPLFRKFANLRVNLAPYILAQARLSQQSGLPLMRGLPLEFPGDRGICAYPYEYLFGDSLLVAPVVEKGMKEWQVNLPRGEWCDLWTGQRVSGGQTLRVAVQRGAIPVYVRKGGIVPLNLGDDLALCAPSSGSPERVKNLAALVFPGELARMELYQGKGAGFGVIGVREKPEDRRVQIDLERLEMPIDLLVLGEAPRQVSLGGSLLPNATDEARPGAAFWEWLPAWQAVRIHLPPSAENQQVIIG